MAVWKMTTVLCLGLLVAPPGAASARADVQDYCAAVARDFADLRPGDRDIWQRRYDDAQRDCIADFGNEATNPSPQVAAKPSAPKVKAKRAVVATSTETQPAASTLPKKPLKKVAGLAVASDGQAKPNTVKPKLIEGTPEWLDYCARKYTSLNREKGTYTSRTGVERKCLITADFN